MITRSLVALIIALCPVVAKAQDFDVSGAIDARGGQYFDIARQIWEWAEVGYQEARSAGLLMKTLEEEGFVIRAGVAGIPTAFVAEYGTGAPVIGILAEYDALPGLSQAAIAQREPVAEGAAGHACGHHLFGAASVAAAVAVKEFLSRRDGHGTIRLYGTPAEEGGAGKVYMVREGLFDDVDAVLHWHPSDRTDASPMTNLANRSAKFRFYGRSTHAAGAPDRGRSALDGVEAMNLMVNMMREHVPQETRIHYVITHGGLAPNVVPDFSEVYYYVRNPSAAALLEIFPRIIRAAEGAALGTGTTMDYEIIHGIHSVLPNEVLSRALYANLQALGGVKYSAEELSFAQAIRSTLNSPDLELGSEEQIQPYEPKSDMTSTDVGDVSYAAPTAGFDAATWVPGTAAHSWQAVAAGGMSIGSKGLTLAAKALAMTAVDLYRDAAVLAAAKAEFEHRRGPDFTYEPLVGDREPPLDYRK